MDCNGNPARRAILRDLRRRLEDLAGPDDVNMDDPQGLRARAERLNTRQALIAAIARLEVEIAQADGVQVSR